MPNTLVVKYMGFREEQRAHQIGAGAASMARAAGIQIDEIEHLYDIFPREIVDFRVTAVTRSEILDGADPNRVIDDMSVPAQELTSVAETILIELIVDLKIFKKLYNGSIKV